MPQALEGTNDCHFFTSGELVHSTNVAERMSRRVTARPRLAHNTSSCVVKVLPHQKEILLVNIVTGNGEYR